MKADGRHAVGRLRFADRISAYARTAAVSWCAADAALTEGFFQSHDSMTPLQVECLRDYFSDGVVNGVAVIRIARRSSRWRRTRGADGCMNAVLVCRVRKLNASRWIAGRTGPIHDGRENRAARRVGPQS